MSPWARLDDGMISAPAIARLSDRAFRLYVSGLVYCARHLTDGALPLAALAFLGASITKKRVVDELVTGGLWEPADHGFTVSRYLSWNDAAETVRNKREQAKQRKLRWLAADGHEPPAPKRISKRISKRVPERIPERVPERVRNNVHATPLHSGTEKSAAPEPARTAAHAKRRRERQRPRRATPAHPSHRVIVKIAHEQIERLGVDSADADIFAAIKTACDARAITHTFRSIENALRSASAQRRSGLGAT